MNHFTLEPAIQQSLLAQGDRVECHNEKGEVVGYFLTPAKYWRMAYDAAKYLVTDEELEAIRQDPGPTHTTAEVLQRLKELSQSYPEQN